MSVQRSIHQKTESYINPHTSLTAPAENKHYKGRATKAQGRKIIPETHFGNILSVLHTWIHRMVWVGRDLKDHLVYNPPCHGKGHHPLDQVAPSPIEPGLEQFQGGSLHSVSVQPVPVPHHHHSKEFLSFI